MSNEIPAVSTWDANPYGPGAYGAPQGAFGPPNPFSPVGPAQARGHEGVAPVTSFQQAPPAMLQGWQGNQAALMEWQNFLDMSQPPMSLGNGYGILANAQDAALATAASLPSQATVAPTPATQGGTATAQAVDPTAQAVDPTAQASDPTLAQQLAYQQMEQQMLTQNQLQQSNIDTTMDFGSSSTSSSSGFVADPALSYDTGDSGDGNSDT